jgi:hypothetical protein
MVVSVGRGVVVHTAGVTVESPEREVEPMSSRIAGIALVFSLGVGIAHGIDGQTFTTLMMSEIDMVSGECPKEIKKPDDLNQECAWHDGDFDTFKVLWRIAADDIKDATAIGPWERGKGGDGFYTRHYGLVDEKGKAVVSVAFGPNPQKGGGSMVVFYYTDLQPVPQKP